MTALSKECMYHKCMNRIERMENNTDSLSVSIFKQINMELYELSCVSCYRYGTTTLLSGIRKICYQYHKIIGTLFNNSNRCLNNISKNYFIYKI